MSIINNGLKFSNKCYSLWSMRNALAFNRYLYISKMDMESSDEPKKESKRLSEFRKKIRETTSIDDLGEQPLTPPTVKEDPLPPWPDNRNPHTGEVNGPRGPEPTRYGDWERKGRVSDF